MTLVKVYMIRTYEMLENDKEQLFAELPSGSIITCTKKYSNTVFEKGVIWESISELPCEAKFIGNYELKNYKIDNGLEYRH